MFNKLAILLTPLLLLGAFVEKRALLTPEDPGPYHARVRDAVDAIPARSGGWEGITADVPEPAQKLLRPNTLLARRYVHRDGRDATLLFVHCRDSRDLAGHYPPVCYRATGWTADADAAVGVTVEGLAIPLRRYAFFRHSRDRGERVVVYGFFVLPGRGLEREMSAVRAAAADYRLRRFGAAQIQIVLPDSLAAAVEHEIVSDLVRLALPAIRAVAERGAEEGRP